MQKLVGGIQRFQNHVVRPHQDFFERLSAGQNPMALFLACSDSRINPNLLTQTRPGDLFVLRNVGNIIPPAGTSNNVSRARFAEMVRHCGSCAIAMGIGARAMSVCSDCSRRRSSSVARCSIESK